jgi:hypothetical protein
MDWKPRILARASAAGRQTLDLADGLGILFPDGNDVFWLLPGEVTSTVPVDVVADAEALWGIYDRVGGLRERVVHVVRHYLASVRVKTTRAPNGHWGIESEGGASSEMSVGADLTRRALEMDDVYALVRSCFQNCMLVRHPPTVMRMNRYLALDGPPRAEAELDRREPHTVAPLLRTMPQFLAMMGLCQTLDRADAPQSAEDLKKAAEPTGPVAQALLRVGERLTGFELSYELTTHQIKVEYADGQDNYSLSPKSRELAENIRTLGPMGAGDVLADEFLAMNERRRRALSAVARAAADRDWGQSRFRSIAFFGIGPTTYLGRTRRELKFTGGRPLTELLRDKPIDAALRQLLAAVPDFAEACVAKLASGDPAAPVPPLPERSLEPDPPAHQPELIELTDATLAAMDAFAARVLSAYRGDKDILRAYHEIDRYLPGIDTWITPMDWIAIAQRVLDTPNEYGWTNPDAITILLDHHIPRGREAALRHLESIKPHHEAWNSEVEMVWRFRHERPAIAAEWFSATPLEAVPYAAVRAELGDPIARWYQAGEEDEGTKDDLSLPPPGQETGPLRQRLVHWARTTWQNPLPAEPLQVARKINAPEVAEALADNRHLLPMLLTFEPRGERLDDPGLLLGESLVLAWSALNPTPLLARLVATAALTDVIRTESRRSFEAAALRNPDVAKSMARTSKMFDSLIAKLQPALAIAWTRYRRPAQPAKT